MDVQERNSTRIYALSTGPTLPEWMGERARRNLSKRDDDIRRRIELIQDFQMPCASSKIIQSKNGKYIMAAGTYSPRIRCYELEELSMKFERVLDGDIMDLCFVGASEDYGKVAILQADRTIQFHAPYGNHASIRIPTFGRNMTYEPTTCELLIASSSTNANSRAGQVYRFNLEEGRFATPLTFQSNNSTNSNNNNKSGANCIAVSPTHSLTALGCEDGLVRFWDNRMNTHDNNNSNFIQLDVKSSTAGFGFYPKSSHTNYSNNDPHEITSLAFESTSGMFLAAGTKGGNVALYDMRSSKPLHIKEHQYGMPIHTVQFHSASSTVLSSDAKLVKIWRSKPGGMSTSNNVILEQDEMDNDVNNIIMPGTTSNNNNTANETNSTSDVGSIVANIEGVGDFTHFITAGDDSDPTGQNSGVVLCAGEQPKMQSFYCPILGAAPKWCCFLDGITEELEERDLNSTSNSNGDGTSTDMMTGKNSGTIYEDYKFLTRSEIDELSIEHLVGTPLLRGYMHGFFIDIGLYNRVRAVANPFEYEEYRKQKIRQKMQDKRASLIAPKKSTKQKTKVNSDLADRLQTKKSNPKDGKVAKSLLGDDRFGSLFTNPDFQIDEEDINFKLRNPSGVAHKKRRDEDMDSDADDDNDDVVAAGFNRVDTNNDDTGWHNDDDDDDNDDDDNSEEENSEDEEEDGIRGGKIRGEMYDQMKEMEKNDKKKRKKKEEKKTSKKKNAGGVKMYEGDDYYDNDGNNNHALNVGLGGGNDASNKKQKELNMSLQQRLELQKEEDSIAINTKRIHVKGEGTSKEVTFIPKDVRKKQMEAAKKAKTEQEATNKSERGKRDRRGIKDLRLKTPFKNQA